MSTPHNADFPILFMCAAAVLAAITVGLARAAGRSGKKPGPGRK